MMTGGERRESDGGNTCGMGMEAMVKSENGGTYGGELGEQLNGDMKIVSWFKNGIK